MVVAIALAAAIAYGAADFYGGLASRRIAAIAVVLWSQSIGLACLLALIPLLHAHASASDLAWGAACGIAGGGAIVLLYRGLAIGVMSVVSPLTAVLAALVPVAWSLATGAHLALVTAAGIIIAIVAVALISSHGGGINAPRAGRSGAFPPGVPEAIGAGMAFGFFFVALAHTDRAAGLLPLVAARVVSIALIALIVAVTRAPLGLARAARPTVAASGVLDMTANVLYVLAVQRGELAVVAVLTSLYPASTVALAALVVHERLAPVQWAGVACALVAVAALAA